MSRTISFCIVLSLFAYNCKPSMHYSGKGKVSDSTHVIIERISSMYDTLVPPKLKTDSIKVYEQLGELLKFSGTLTYNNEIRVASYNLIVGDDGRLQDPIFHKDLVKTTKDIEADMIKVMDYLLMNLTEWEPAFLKKDPLKKIPFSVEIVFYFDRNEIQFIVEGSGSYYFLRRAYKPKYLKVD